MDSVISSGRFQVAAVGLTEVTPLLSTPRYSKRLILSLLSLTALLKETETTMPRVEYMRVKQDQMDKHLPQLHTSMHFVDHSYRSLIQILKVAVLALMLSSNPIQPCP